MPITERIWFKLLVVIGALTFIVCVLADTGWPAETDNATVAAADAGQVAAQAEPGFWAEQPCGAEKLEICRDIEIPADIRGELEERLDQGRCVFDPLHFQPFKGRLYSFGTFEEQKGDGYVVLSARVYQNVKKLVYKNSRKVCGERQAPKQKERPLVSYRQIKEIIKELRK